MMVKNKKFFVVITLLLVLLVAAGGALALPTATTARQEQQGNVLDVLRGDDRFETMLALVRAGALADNLDHGGPYTVFAPTDEAFTAFEAMTERPGANLTEILLYHVVNGRYSVSDLRNHDSLTTLLGDHIDISEQGDTIMLDNQVQIISTSIEASNGVVHVIDTVLIPKLESQEPEAPTATPADATPEATPGVVTATLVATPVQPGVTVTPAAPTDETNTLDFLDRDGRFDTFLSLLDSANLTSRVRDADDMTLFAPTDEAFEALSSERIDELLSDVSEGGELDHVLRYHMVGDSLNSNQIATDNLIPTLDGRPLFVDLDEEGQILLNGARRIVQADIQTANGIVHVIDSVLIP